ncbi:dihydrofolate reductase [Pectobacterium phage POP12]|nr:dihydrofolate reductase [Pectobacterium phage POP12]
MTKVKLVFAVGGNDIDQFVEFAFGNKGKLPWGHIPEDLKFFQKITKNDVLIMGSKTFMSLPKKLSGRVHVVLSSRGERIVTESGERPDIIIGRNSISNTVDYVRGLYPEHDISIIGGKQILLDAIENKVADEIYMNIIYPTVKNFETDVSFTATQLGFHNKGYELNEETELETIQRDGIGYILSETWIKE